MGFDPNYQRSTVILKWTVIFLWKIMILNQMYHVDLWGGGVIKAKTPHIVCGLGKTAFLLKQSKDHNLYK